MYRLYNDSEHHLPGNSNFYMQVNPTCKKTLHDKNLRPHIFKISQFNDQPHRYISMQRAFKNGTKKIIFLQRKNSAIK